MIKTLFRKYAVAVGLQVRMPFIRYVAWTGGSFSPTERDDVEMLMIPSETKI